MNNNFTEVSSKESVDHPVYEFDCGQTSIQDSERAKRKLSFDPPITESDQQSSKNPRAKSVGRESSNYLERNPSLKAIVAPPTKFKIILECPRKQKSFHEFADEETGVSTIDLSRERREKKERHFDEGGVSIMATALTAAAFSGYLLVRSFKTFLV